ncbi:MAG TPA: hypothetical protein VGB17_16455 [Pyrinomonadaceae bacterium]
MKKILPALFICLISLSLANAQGDDIPARGKYKHHKPIETKYDKFKDETRVRVKYLSVTNKKLGAIDISATYYYQGQTPSKPDSITLSFSSTSREWAFLNNRELAIIADGQRFLYDDAALVNARLNSGPYVESVSERLSVPLPLADFLKIINSKSVQMKLGRFDFSLAQDHLEALRDFASRMNP